MAYTVIVRSYPQKRPNGDRATRSTPCHRHTVCLNTNRGGQEREVVLSEFDEYDSFMTSVDTSGKVIAAAKKYANVIADFMACPVVFKNMVEKAVTVTQWVEDDE